LGYKLLNQSGSEVTEDILGCKIVFSKHDAFADHFADGVAVRGERLSSGFMAGLRDARMLTGRDCEIGEKISGKEQSGNSS
jgi:hypothetical protein